MTQYKIDRRRLKHWQELNNRWPHYPPSKRTCFHEAGHVIVRHAVGGQTLWVAAAPSVEPLDIGGVCMGGESIGYLPGNGATTGLLAKVMTSYAGIIAECRQRHARIDAWISKHAAGDMVNAVADETLAAKGAMLARKVINAEWYAVERLAHMLRERRVMKGCELWPVLNGVRRTTLTGHTTQQRATPS